MVGRYNTEVSRKAQVESLSPVSTRDAILESATKLFSTKGFAGTSMSDLAEDLGLSKAAIYHHFESKGSILQNLIESPQEDIETLVNHTESLPANKVNPREILRTFAGIVFEHRKVIGLVLTEMPPEMKAQEPDRHQLLMRLQQLIGGRKPTAEMRMRARAAVGIILTGIVLPLYEQHHRKEEFNLDLLVKIASDALGVK